MATPLKVELGIDDGQLTQTLAKDTKSAQDFAQEVRQSASAVDDEVKARVRNAAQYNNYKQQLRMAVKEVQNLTIAYRNLSREEKAGAVGQEFQRRIDAAKAKAADLTDTIGDLNEEIKHLASDTTTLDAFKDSISTVRDAFGAWIAIAQATGAETENLEDTVKTLGTVYLAANGVIKVFSAFQKNSSLMVAANAIVNKAAAASIVLKTAAEKIGIRVTRQATVSQLALNAAIKASPYVLIASVIIGAVTALYQWTKANKEAQKEVDAHKKRIEELREQQQRWYKSVGDAAGNLIGKYHKLSDEWKKLQTTSQKNKWIKENANEFKNLGLKILTVSDAENAFVKNTNKVVQALQLRARAMALEQKMMESYKEYYSRDEELSTYKRKVWKKGDTAPRETLEKAGVRPDNLTMSGDKKLTSQADIDKLNAYEAKKSKDLNTQKRADNNKRIQAEEKRYAQAIDAIIKKQKNLGLGTMLSTGTTTPEYPEKTSGSSSSKKEKEEEKALKGSLEALRKEKSDLQKILEKGTWEAHGKTFEGVRNEINDLDKQIKDKEFILGFNMDPASVSLETLQEQFDKLYAKSRMQRPKIGLNDEDAMKKIKAHKAQIESVRRMYQVLTDRKYELGLDVHQPEEAISELYDKLDKLTERLSEVETIASPDFSDVMKQFDELFAEVQAKKVEMDVELNVDSNTLDSFMAQIKSDASELHDLSISPDVDTDEAQKRIAELTRSLQQTKQAFEKEKIAIVPDISKVQPSLNAMENRLSALQDKLKSATTIDDKDVQKVSEEIRKLYKDIQKKRVELNVDVIANDEKLENLKKRIENTPMTIEASKSSFQKAVPQEQPGKKDYEGQLAAIEQQMDFNDSLIDQLKEIAEEYKNLGDAGKEGFEEVSDKIKETQEAQDALAESAKKVDKQNKKQKKNAKNWESAADAVGSFGDAMSALGSATESPELNVAGIIAQAIAELSLNGMKSLAACTTPWEYIAAAAGIIATIAATAAQVHSAVGSYATGGIVPGNSYSGDRVNAHLNSGEMVLNSSHINKLWNFINSPMDTGVAPSTTGQVEFFIQGDMLRGVLKNTNRKLARQGRNTKI